MSALVYLDYHATTPVDPRVLEEMLPFLREHFGNAASRSHPFGWKAERAVDEARDRIAALIGGRGREVVFTGGATESNNLAIKGALEFRVDRGRHVVTGATEHKSVLESLNTLEKKGLAEVSILPVDREGRVDPEAVRGAIRDDTVLVSLMAANNEIGTLHQLAAIGEITREGGVLFHTDAAQAVGKVPIDVEGMGIDLLSLTAHKVYGPKGAGALWIRSRSPRVRILPQIHGGGQERGQRSGTLNVPGIVGLGAACTVASGEMASEAVRLGDLRDRLEMRLRELDDVRRNGHPTETLPGNLNLCFGHIEAESLLMSLNQEVALSSGSACTSAMLEPSHVLQAIGLSNEQAHGSVRFGLGRQTTSDEIDRVASRVIEEVRRLRHMSPLYGVA